MRSRFFLTVALTVLIAGCARQRAAAQPARPDDVAPPNVVVFVADDANWDDVGAYGNDAIRTPVIDAMAARGFLAERAFLTTPQCSPSRISLLSGRYAHDTRTEDLHVPAPQGLRLLPSYLAQAGYVSGLMQKSHLGPAGDAQFDWYEDSVGADAVGRFLDHAGDRPFFLWVGFRDPHRPYPATDLPVRHDPAAVRVPPALVDDAATRRDLADYYDEIARMDAAIGAALDQLDQRGLRQNTLAIYLSDNGRPFPRAKGTLYDDGVRTPFVASWPARIAPGTVYPGLVSLIDLAPTVLDLAGLDRAGLAGAEAMAGQSFAAAFTDPAVPGRDAVFAERNWHDADEHMRALRTDRYKVIVNAYAERPHGSTLDITTSPSWQSLFSGLRAGRLTPAQADLFRVPRPRVELYDVVEDPHELVNLAGLPAYADTLRTMLRALDAWSDDSNDFPSWTRHRDDILDRTTGVRFWWGDGPRDLPALQGAAPEDPGDE